jgi:hypothetical protein
MAKQNEVLAKDIEQIRGELQKMRDEIRVRLHLGAMDARDAFSVIERDLERVGGDLSNATRRTLLQARTHLQELAAAFRG